MNSSQLTSTVLLKVKHNSSGVEQDPKRSVFRSIYLKSVCLCVVCACVCVCLSVCLSVCVFVVVCVCVCICVSAESIREWACVFVCVCACVCCGICTSCLTKPEAIHPDQPPPALRHSPLSPTHSTTFGYATKFSPRHLRVTRPATADPGGASGTRHPPLHPL